MSTVTLSNNWSYDRATQLFLDGLLPRIAAFVGTYLPWGPVVPVAGALHRYQNIDGNMHRYKSHKKS